MSVSAILLLVLFTRRVYPGFGCWVLWQTSATAGVLLFATRGPDPAPHIMILTAALLLLAPAFLFHGRMRFCRAGGRPWAVLSVYAIVAVALLAHAYFTYPAPSVEGRLVGYSATRTVLLACCALEPLRSHRSEERRVGEAGVSTCSSRWSRDN